MTDAFRAGNLRNHSNAWSTIETPLPVIDWINSGVRLHFSKDSEGFVLPNHLLSAKQEPFVDREIHDLLTSGAIEECLDQPHCVSPIGCVPKKNKKFRLIAGSKTPKFGQRDPQVSVRKHFNGLRPSAPTQLASHARYQERISPYPCAFGPPQIPRYSLERPLVSMDSSSVRIQRKSVFFLQNTTTGNSASTSTRFAARCLCGRYFTYGSPVRDREPQAAFTGHVNAFRMANQLGKVVPSARP